MFTSRKEYLDIIVDIEKKLYSKFEFAGKINDWFLIRINLGFFFHLIYGNINSLNQDVPLYNGGEKKSLVFSCKRIIKIVYLFFKIQYFKIILKNKLSKNNLYLGYAKHSKNNYNMYIHPFSDEDNDSVLFYYDYQNNNLLLQRFFSYLEQYYSLIRVEKKAVHHNNAIVVETLKAEYDISSNYIYNYLNTAISRSKQRYEIFHTFLKTVNPKQVFVYCYYDSYANSALVAANILNIKTIEYQHSSMSDSHFGYANWKNPSEFSEHFPKTFFLWDEESSDVVSKNFSDSKTFPTCIVTGNKFLLQGINDTDNFSNPDSHNNILICLQGLWIPEFLETFILKDNIYNWYIRLHPRYPQDKKKLDNFIILKKNSIHTDEANNSDLYKLLEKVTFVITSFSGVALEAETFRKKVIIFGEEGLNTYRNKIEERKYNFVENYESLDAILNENI